MRLERTIYSVLILVAATIAVINWRRAEIFRSDNEDLRARVEELETESAASSTVLELARGQSEKLRAQNLEIMKLRNDVTQSRVGTKEAEALAAENQRLKAMAQAKPNSAEADGNAQRGGGRDFPRESWSFSGYASPESALVSAIWAMKEGNPQTYLESLTPQEQERMASVWQDKAENEIAEKHKNDVSAIAGLRVLERQDLSPTEVVMNVYLEGPGRVEKIRMNQVGQDWKFGGFIREAPPAQ